MRRLILVLVLMAAARMAKRSMAREAGAYAEIMAALWRTAGLLLAASASNTPKTRNVEDRLNLLVPRIPVPQTAPGTTAGGTSSGSDGSYSSSNSSYSTSNSSYSMSNIQATATTAPTNDGGSSASNTGGQVGGASAHYHPMGHQHTTSADLQAIFNTLQGSYSNTVPAVNALQGSYSNLVPAYNTLQSSHAGLVVVANNLVSDHARLITDHNNLKQSLINSGILH